MVDHTRSSLEARSRDSSYATINDLGLVESNVPQDQHDDEVEASKEIYQSLEPIKTSQTRKSNNALTSTLSRTISKVRTSDSIPIGPPPDGGVVAWTQAALTHLVIFNTWGFINSFGLFQSYYVNTMHIGAPSAVAWIGTVQVFILFNVGTFSGRMTDAGFFKVVFVAGVIISQVGIFMLSLCTKYWQIFLAQGVCIGLGFGLVFVPSTAIVSSYFLKNRSAALGIAVTGSATGGLVFPAIGQQLMPTLGFGWTVRVMGFVQLACFIVCALFMKPRLPPRKTGPIIEWTSFRELPYTLYLLCGFFFFWAVYVGFFFVTSYGRSVLGMTQADSINLLLVMNGVGVVARMAINFSAGYTGPLNMLLPFIIATGIMSFAWIAVRDVSGLWAFAAVYGVSAAGLQGLWPVALTSLTTDPKKLGVRTGMGFAFVGFAVLTGTPIGGALIQVMDGDYLGCQIFGGVSLLISAGLLVATRWAVLRKQGKPWTWAVKV